jgi:hypothetical protein
MIARLYADAFGRLSDPIERFHEFLFQSDAYGCPRLTSAKTSPAFALSMAGPTGQR